MTPDETHSPAAPPWSAREMELLAVTLELLQEHGYDGLTIDAVAAGAHASKATVYRRWPSKAELVLAAFAQSVQQEVGAPNTGTLRGDLLRLGTLMCEQADQHSGTIAAVLTELSHNPALAQALQQEFIHQRKAAMHRVLHQAVARGEIVPGVISDEVWDVLPGYLVSRHMIPGRPVTDKTVEALVDEVMMPSLTRPTKAPDKTR